MGDKAPLRYLQGGGIFTSQANTNSRPCPCGSPHPPAPRAAWTQKPAKLRHQLERPRVNRLPGFLLFLGAHSHLADDIKTAYAAKAISQKHYFRSGPGR
jgi:hypothetical protein